MWVETDEDDEPSCGEEYLLENPETLVSHHSERQETSGGF
jgi:hypothetical protein